MRRRTFIKGAGAATGAAVVGGGSAALDGGPISEARALLPLLGVAAGGAAIGYLAKKGVDMYLGDDRDYSGYTGADALHQEITAGALNMRSANERVMTSITNNIANSANIALAKGKAAIIEKMNNEKSESAAQTAMQTAIDDYYSTIQINILRHIDAQIRQYYHFMQQVDSHADLTMSDVLTPYNISSDYSKETVAVNLLNGDTEDLTRIKYNGTSGTDRSLPYHWFDQTSVSQNVTHHLTTDATITSDSPGSPHGIKDPDSSDEIVIYGEKLSNEGSQIPQSLFDAWSDLIDERDSVNSNLSGFVSDVYANYSAGEIPTEDLVDPITAATELEQDYGGYQAQGAHAAMLGIPTSAEQSVDMTIQASDGDKNVLADIFTNHVPTDGSGNEIGFEAGTTYSPSSWSEPLYIAYEYTNDGETASEFTQVESDFTINSITNTDTGEALTDFSPTNRNNQTVDVTKLKEELAQVREEQIRLQEEAQESTSGGAGGGFFDGGNQTTLLAVGGAALALVFGLGGTN